MKSIVLALFLFAALFAYTSASCEKQCNYIYIPCCVGPAGPPSSSDITIGNECYLDVLNCLNGWSYVYKHDGEC